MNVRKIAAAACGLLLASLSATLSPTPARAQTAPQYYFYLLQTHDMPAPEAFGIAKELGYLPAVQQPSIALAVHITSPVQTWDDANGVVRMAYYYDLGKLSLFPDLSQSFGTVPTQQAAETAGETFLSQRELLPAVQDQGGSYVPDDVVTLANQSYVAPNATGGGGGPTGPPTDQVQSVHYQLMLDGLPVMGRDYILTADVATLPGATAPTVIGFNYNFRYFKKDTTLTPVMITQDAATTIFNRQFAPILKEIRNSDPNTSESVVSTTLEYFEQSQSFIQPVYAFKVLLTSSNGTQIGETWMVPAASNSPEGIRNVPVPRFATSAIFPSPNVVSAASQPLPSVKQALGTQVAKDESVPAAKKPVVFDPLDFGVYVVRDDNRFLDDANGFIANLESNNLCANAFLGRGYPQTVLDQYYWDYPWLWENDPTDGVPDNSPFFVGAENLVLYEGHGAPWLTTCESNCCDLINYTTIPGYGASHLAGEKTNYICWHTCDSIPAPGDPYGGYYASPAGPFDVWWGVFQGMRGTYGSRTTVDIYDGVGPAFAAAAGLGVPNLSAWFNAETNDATGHGGGWDYACAVIISGHENDCIYDTGQEPPPGSLTMWWQHP